MNYIKPKTWQDQKTEHMLNNAAKVQYFKNIIQNASDDENVWLERYGVECEYELTVGEYYESAQKWQLEPWIFKFLIKQRKLRSGLATPMARHLAWSAISKSRIHQKKEV